MLKQIGRGLWNATAAVVSAPLCLVDFALDVECYTSPYRLARTSHKFVGPAGSFHPNLFDYQPSLASSYARTYRELKL